MCNTNYVCCCYHAVVNGYKTREGNGILIQPRDLKITPLPWKPYSLYFQLRNLVNPNVLQLHETMSIIYSKYFWTRKTSKGFTIQYIRIPQYQTNWIYWCISFSSQNIYTRHTHIKLPGQKCDKICVLFINTYKFSLN